MVNLTHQVEGRSLILLNVLSPSTAQVVIEIAAILAFALSGMFEAARKKLDVVGVCMVMGLAAFGGGTLRDILLDRRPFFWVEHSAWLWVFLSLSVLAMHFVRTRNFELTVRLIQWPDALGLGLFTATGTQLALASTLPPTVAVLMGMITAVFGGVLRDIVCNEIPQAFRDHRPYAVCSFLGAWCVIFSSWLGMPDWTGLVIGAAVTFCLRSMTILFDWRLPSWRQ